MNFVIRLSPTFSTHNVHWDIELPQVPVVGDTISLSKADDDPIVYEVLARRFIVEFNGKGDQFIGEGIKQPKALLHVREIA